MSNSVKFIPTEISIKRGFIMITFNFEISVGYDIGSRWWGTRRCTMWLLTRWSYRYHCFEVTFGVLSSDIRSDSPTGRCTNWARTWNQLAATRTAAGVLHPLIDLLWSVLSMHLPTKVKACISTSEICCNRGSSCTAWSLLSSICTLGISTASLVRTQTASQCELNSC